jgi:hypothetical protein
LRWPGERPRVALRTLNLHGGYSSYRTDPPVRYAPSPIAQLDHWVNPRTGEAVVRYYGRSLSTRKRPYILETEHWSTLGPFYHGPRSWELSLANRDSISRWFGDEGCRGIVTLSPGYDGPLQALLVGGPVAKDQPSLLRMPNPGPTALVRVGPFSPSVTASQTRGYRKQSTLIGFSAAGTARL